MLVVAVVLFALAAAVGMFLAVVRARTGANPPTAAALVHGALAAAALVTLLVFVTTAATPTLPTVAAGLFIVAALGGFVLLASHLRQARIPLSLMAVHSIVAVVAFVVLVAAVVGGAA